MTLAPDHNVLLLTEQVQPLAQGVVQKGYTKNVIKHASKLAYTTSNLT
jgi:hypothetical protein